MTQGVVGGGGVGWGGDSNVRARLHYHDAGHVVDGASCVMIGFQSQFMPRQRIGRAIQK